MAFESIVTVPGSSPKRGSISYKRNHRKKSGRADPHLIVAIPKAIANGSVQPGDCYQLQLGSGDDAGKARLVKDKYGIIAHVLRGGVTIRFGYVPRLGHDAAEKEEIDVRPLANGEFEFDVPRWFK